jgi:FkbM family methyltransferase
MTGRPGGASEFKVTDIPGNGLYEFVIGRHGMFIANPRDTFVGRSLVRYGEFSELEWRAIDQLTPEGRAVIEVGANIGVHTVALARKVGPRGFVHAYEPQPIVFQNLCANLALNGLTNVHAVLAACAGAPGMIAVPRIDYSVAANFGGIALADLPKDRAGSVGVPVVRLDDAYDGRRPALIKIDVEGMEHSVLEGAAGLIERHRPALYVENDRPEKSRELLTLVFDLGYRAWWHLPPLFNPGNFAGESENLFGRTMSVNMICIPKERQANISGLREIESAAERLGFEPAATAAPSRSDGGNPRQT